MNVQKLKVRDVLALFCSCLAELKRRGVTRSTNSPVADYAELLFQRAFGWTLCPKSTKGYDATDSAGKKFEVKGRRLTSHNASRQLSSIRGLDDKHFHYLAGVLFDSDFNVQRACLIPRKQVKALSKYSKHTNSWILHLRESVWDRPGVIDVTKALSKAQRNHTE